MSQQMDALGGRVLITWGFRKRVGRNVRVQEWLNGGCGGCNQSIPSILFLGALDGGS